MSDGRNRRDARASPRESDGVHTPQNRSRSPLSPARQGRDRSPFYLQRSPRPSRGIGLSPPGLSLFSLLKGEVPRSLSRVFRVLSLLRMQERARASRGASRQKKAVDSPVLLFQIGRRRRRRGLPPYALLTSMLRDARRFWMASRKAERARISYELLFPLQKTSERRCASSGKWRAFCRSLSR